MTASSEADFVSVDLELANRGIFSICQIGIAEFVNGRLEHQWMSYVDPETTFGAHNIAIHGITEAEVQDWPKLPEIADLLRELLGPKIALSHSGTDRVALESAFDRYKMSRLQCNWLDTAKVAQRAWRGFKKGGYGLQNLCRLLGYHYHSHDALGDAKAAGVVMLAAIEQTGIGLHQWLEQVELPIGDGPRLPIRALSQIPIGIESTATEAESRPSNQVISPEMLRLLAGQSAGDSGHNYSSNN